ncbi:MAG: efflux RND transporter periplasmic adaptor subunit, partial [Candidatus Wallbacteria bacterium]|nr:efflux RND transporter periplasmic adaptor subunit [Candidatus Wallbacteria bacterium]
MKRKIWIIVIVLAIVICTAAGCYQLKKKTEKSGDKPYGLHCVTPGTLEITMTFPGSFCFQESQIQYARVSGMIVSNLVQAGDIIKPGDAIFCLDTLETLAGKIAVGDELLSLQDEIENERLELESGPGIAVEEDDLWRRKIDYFQKELKLVTREKNYSLKEYIVAQENLVNSRRSALTLSKDRACRSIRGTLRLDNLRDKLARSKERMAQYSDLHGIRFAGHSPAMLTEFLTGGEKLISERSRLFSFAYLKDFQITASVDPADYFRFNPGDVATVEIRYLSRSLTAEVLHTSPIFSTGTSLPKGTVRFSVPAASGCLYPNLDCDIRVGTMVRNALLIPVSCITEKEEGRMFINNRNDKGGTFAFVYDEKEGKAR